MRRLLFALLFLFLACAHQPIVYDPMKYYPEHYYHWQPKHMRVLLPLDAPECAFWTLQEAWKLLEPGVGVSVQLGTPRELSEGQVRVFWAAPDRAEALAMSGWQHRGWEIDRSDMWITVCDVRVMAHELGHILGLPDVHSPGRVMHFSAPEIGWELVESEREVLRSAGN